MAIHAGLTMTQQEMEPNRNDTEKADFVVLYTHPGTYTAACLRMLVQLSGWRIVLVHDSKSQDIPLPEPRFDDSIVTLRREDFPSSHKLVELVRRTGARIVYIAGWADKDYLRAARILRSEDRLVICGCDNQDSGSLRQKFAQRIASWHLHPAIDILWVTGERARQFAWRLGYRGAKCWTGVYCCDLERFLQAAPAVARTPYFLFVGRYVERKGLDVLLAAYRSYRSGAKEPWELHCAGAGPLKWMLEGVPGVRDLGFVQPEDLPNLMGACSCFVLPSRFEAWGVVIQEAAGAGVPIICSDVVGAASHLLREHFTGWTFSNESVEELTHAMKYVCSLPEDRRRLMGENGRALARTYSPESWARTLLTGCDNWFTLRCS